MPTPDQDAGVVCAFFKGFEGGDEVVICQLGHRPTRSSFYCLTECGDYCPGQSREEAKKIQQGILELVKGEVWTEEEIADLLALKEEEEENGG